MAQLHNYVSLGRVKSIELVCHFVPLSTRVVHSVHSPQFFVSSPIAIISNDFGISATTIIKLGDLEAEEFYIS